MGRPIVGNMVPFTSLRVNNPINNPAWILATGFWNNLGVWDNSAVWIN